MGGDCTFTGCVPSKTLLAAAARGDNFGDAMAAVRKARGPHRRHRGRHGPRARGPRGDPRACRRAVAPRGRRRRCAAAVAEDDPGHRVRARGAADRGPARDRLLDERDALLARRAPAPAGGARRRRHGVRDGPGLRPARLDRHRHRSRTTPAAPRGARGLGRDRRRARCRRRRARHRRPPRTRRALRRRRGVAPPRLRHHQGRRPSPGRGGPSPEHRCARAGRSWRRAGRGRPHPHRRHARHLRPRDLGRR